MSRATDEQQNRREAMVFVGSGVITVALALVLWWLVITAVIGRDFPFQSIVSFGTVCFIMVAIAIVIVYLARRRLPANLALVLPAVPLIFSALLGMFFTDIGGIGAILAANAPPMLLWALLWRGSIALASKGIRS